MTRERLHDMPISEVTPHTEASARTLPRLRIAFVYPELRWESPCGKALLRLIDDLAPSHEITAYANRIEPDFLDRVRFVRVPGPVRPYLANYLLFHVLSWSIFLLRRLFLRERFDVVQSVDSHCLFANVVTVHYCNAERLRLIRAGVFQPHPRLPRRIYDALNHRLAKAFELITYRLARPSRIICISRGLQRNIADHYGARRGVVVIPNSADFPESPPGRDEARRWLALEHGIPPEAFVLLFVAASDWGRKGLRHLLEAMPGLPDDVRLLVVGAGSTGQRAGHESISRALGIEDRVVFAGKRSDMQPYLRGSDLFVFPSHFEGFALVTLEAAAAGLPMLCTDVNGVQDLFGSSGCGIIIEPSAADIRTHVLALRHDPATRGRMSQAALARAESFSRAAVARLTLEEYLAVARDRTLR